MTSYLNMWIFLFLLSTGYCENCAINLYCWELDENICAEVSSGDLILNGIGCNSYEESCLYEDVLEFYSKYSTSAKESLKCSLHEYEYAEEQNILLAEDYCTHRTVYEQQRLKEGSHLKLCDSDEDCELESGEYANCTCSALLGKKFCNASKGDAVVEGIFDIACNKEYKRLAYMDAYLKAFIPLISKQMCSDRIYTELIMYSALQVELSRDLYTDATSSAVYYSILYTLLASLLV